MDQLNHNITELDIKELLYILQFISMLFKKNNLNWKIPIYYLMIVLNSKIIAL